MKDRGNFFFLMCVNVHAHTHKRGKKIKSYQNEDIVYRTFSVYVNICIKKNICRLSS